MKKRFPSLLIVICIIFIAIGIIGILAAKRNTSPKPQDYPTPILQSSDNNTENPNYTNVQNITHFNNLDDVKMMPATPSQIKNYTGFRLSFNPENRTPNWVAWELLVSETGGNAKRSNKFWTDYDITNTSENSDYTRSGYDRGHLCPAADQKWSAKAMEDCFVMSNMCPQDHALNAGAWNTLENKERTWAQRDSAIIIVAGPIYSESDKTTIGENKVRVPGAFFKCIIAPYLEQPRGIAFVFPNMTSPGNMENYVMTIDQVEQLTGLDFFYALPDDLEEKIESVSSFREWNHRK